MSSGSVVLCLRIYDELSLTVRKEWTLNSFPQFHVWSLPVFACSHLLLLSGMASSKLFHKTSRWLFEFGWRHGQSSILLSSFTIHWAHSALLCERWEINNTRWGLALSAPLFPLSAGTGKKGWVLWMFPTSKWMAANSNVLIKRNDSSVSSLRI